MTVNHKVEVELKHNIKENLGRNKEKIKVGLCCLVIGGIYGFTKGVNAGGQIAVNAIKGLRDIALKVNS